MNSAGRLGIVIVAGTLLGVPGLAEAQQRCSRPVALFESVTHTVALVQASTRIAVPGVRLLPICSGDTIRVGDDSRAVILVLASNTPLAIDQNSEFAITERGAEEASLVDLIRGAILFITRMRRAIEVRTPFVNASVEGTEFVVRVEQDRAVVTVIEGTVRTENPLGTLLVGAGQQAMAVQGQAPQLEITVHPRDAVQWALYYEPVLPSDSFEALAQVPGADRNSAFYVRRAGLLLGAGQLDEALSDITRAQELNPSSGDTYTLRTIIAVALNDRAEALQSGRMAVERSPRSAAARVALSHALQGDFQLDAARDVVEDAVKMSPEDAAAWARLAELRLMLDDVGGAGDAARRAASLSPRTPRAQAVLGFVWLAQMHFSEAETAFEQAVTQEPSNPVARFGRGLAKIRRGRLAEGRGDLEVAVALDPGDSLLRSYLGKAYFEEKRAAFAARELDLAKALDPLDPTPWFYDAVRAQVQNQPVEALRDLRRSVDLNGNRAVYRSRLLLDSDLAVRGARLGRIYRDLGFERLALLEGWTSVAVDPSNHAAHRLLADNYLALPRHQIARDSELLQAQLLQPLNLNPVQPRLADNGLAFLDDTGVAGVGYNEFTRLFARNQLSFVADGIIGSQSTAADTVIASGLFHRLSFSAGQFHFDTNGVRENNDATENVSNAFLQAAISSATSAQVEVRVTEVELGDRRMLFDSANFLNRLRTTTDTTSIRFGIRHNFAPGSVLIGSLIHRNADGDFNTGVGLRVLTGEDADFVEVRHLQELSLINITAGVGRYLADRAETRVLGPRTFPRSQTSIDHSNGYLYFDVKLPRQLTVSAGGGYEAFDNALIKRHPANPKVAFTWPVSPTITIRGAAFKAFKRSLVLSQTIEPTQLAGFNQFFDDTTASESWREGLAIDRQFGKTLYSGVEMSHRSVDVPVRFASTGLVTVRKEAEWLGEAYVNAAAADRLTFNLRYQFERLKRDPQGNNAGLLAESSTHKLAIEGRLFANTAAFGRLRATLVDQRGRFQNPRLVVIPGSDRLWTIDASIGYRLPRQRGVLAIEARNVTNNAFNFQDSTPEEPTIPSKRLLLARVTVAF